MMMLLWGPYPFSIHSAAYQELQRTTEWRWPSVELFGAAPSPQYVGPGEDSITLPGVIYPEWKGGTGQLDAMRLLAGQGTPQLLISGTGKMLGRWAATTIVETQSTFAAAGIPLKQEFQITLKRFPDPAIDAVVNALAIKSALVSAVSSAKSAVDQVRSSAGVIQTAIATARAVVTSAAGVIGAPAATIIAAANIAERTAGEIKTLGTTAAELVGARPTTESARAGLGVLVAGLPTLAAQASVSSTIIKAAVAQAVDDDVAPAGLVAANAALVAANKLTRLASVSYHSTRAASKDLT